MDVALQRAASSFYGRTILATTLRVIGPMTKTMGKATAQLAIHDPIQTPAKPSINPIARHVAMQVTKNVIKQVRIRPNRIGAARWGNIMWAFCVI